MWGNSNATQCVTLNDDGTLAWSWNNSGNGFNAPEVWSGTPRYCGTNNWNIFPIQYKNINTCNAYITYKFTQKPTQGTWWNFGFDIYWKNATTGCFSYSNCDYNIMIWIHGKPEFTTGTFIKDVQDKYGNTWSYYRRLNASPPWDGFVLKNRNNIPYEPVANQQYNISIDIKKLMSEVTGNLSGEWYVPGLELGCENSGMSGATSGAIKIDAHGCSVKKFYWLVAYGFGQKWLSSHS